MTEVTPHNYGSLCERKEEGLLRVSLVSGEEFVVTGWPQKETLHRSKAFAVGGYTFYWYGRWEALKNNVFPSLKVRELVWQSKG